MKATRTFFILLALMTAAGFTSGVNAATIPVEDFAKFPEFTSPVISPDGKHLAVAMPSGGQTGLQIIDISNPAKGFRSTAAYRFPKLEHVLRIHWASNKRVVFETTREYDVVGDIQPRLTGIIYAINADGSDKSVIFGTRQRVYQEEYAFVIDSLIESPDHVLVLERHYGKHSPKISRLNVNNGSLETIAASPFDDGGFVLDGNAFPRVAFKYDGMDESLHIAFRRDVNEEWKTRQVPKKGGFFPAGFTREGVFVVENLGEPLGLFRYDIESDDTSPLLTDDTVEAGGLLTSFDGRALIGATFHDGVPENRYFDADHPQTRIRQMLDRSFPGTHVRITSATTDERKLLLEVTADRLPTEYYLFDVDANRADFLMSSYQWLDPARLGVRQPVTFTSRDGVELHAYLTLPVGTEKPENLPLVTIVHGGPHGVRDTWYFDHEAQLLASRGYAVLQTNYRGSGGYGNAFGEAGWKRWGTRIQEDITDGVLWAIEQGIADKDRLCIYGASFGGYSVLSQLTREPDLYKCGFAFVGIYDLEHMLKVGDVPFYAEGEAFLQRVLGDDTASLRAQSPVHGVDRIKAGLYIAHGREDKRAHYSHFGILEKALKKADVPYESMVKHKEAHGFVDMDNRIELYTELVDFIDAHIGRN